MTELTGEAMPDHSDTGDSGSIVDRRLPVRRDFGELVRDALKNLHDLASLQTHPLIAFVPPGERAGAIQAGRVLEQSLREAIASLHDERGATARVEVERRYRLLTLRYVDGLAPPLVQQELSISRSTYQREHIRALTVLTSVLAERWQVAGPDNARSSQLAVTDRPIPPVDPERSASSPAGELAASLTSFIGRESELETVIRLLGAGRLVTLTGPPGIGKTKLAVEVATALKETFDHGICFVSLASVREPGLVASSIAWARGLRERPDRTVLEALADDLRGRHLLLILDNFEQLLNAAPTVANLLATAPDLHALVTSRAPLHVRGEVVFQVPPLALPEPPHENQTGSAAALQDVSSVRLFVERAQAVNSDFVLTDENAADVIEICRRVDGLPLAIELAAAWSRVLSPRAIRARLERRLSLLTSGQRDLPERQQALRTAIDWSYDLLDDDAKQLFRRLGIFEGSCDLEAVEAVCAEPGDHDVDHLGQISVLVDHSLLARDRQLAGEPRFRMLESIREYALEQLTESREDDLLWRRYADYYRELGRQAMSALWLPEQRALIQRLDAEHDNFRGVLGWLVGREDAEAGLDLAGALAWYWLNCNFWTEGRRWLRRILALPGAAERSLSRARALLGAGVLAVTQGDFTAARDLLTESSAIFRERGEKRGLAPSLGALANVSVRNRERGARALVIESLALFRELGDRSRAAQMLLQLGAILTYERDYPAAQRALFEGLAHWQEIGDTASIAEAIRRLGDLALAQGDHSLARARLQESMAMYQNLGEREAIAKQGISVALNRLGELAEREGSLAEAETCEQEALQLAHDLGDRHIVASALQGMGRVKRQVGDASGALACFRESLFLRHGQGHTWGIAVALREIAESMLTLGDPALAVRYYSAAGRLHRVSDVLASTDDPADYDPANAERNLTAAKAILGSEAFVGEWEAGEKLTLDEVVGDALQTSAPEHI